MSEGTDRHSEFRYSDESDFDGVFEIREEFARLKDLKQRTMDYALEIIRIYSLLPKTETARVIGRQFLRSGTSPGAHYRDAARARSVAEFVSKMEGGLQELEETDYWLELTYRSGLLAHRELAHLIQETDELTAIFTTCVKNAKRK